MSRPLSAPHRRPLLWNSVVVLTLAVASAGLARAQSSVTPDSVATAPGIRIDSRQSGASRARLDSTDARQAAALTFSELLQARAASVSVMMSGGTLTGGGRLWVRGPSSVSTAAAPLLIVDGMRVSEHQDGDLTTESRLDDIAVDDVASIEVLRGPAAAALYGAGASPGAIIVTTKKGSAGRLRLDARVMSEARWDAGRYADSYVTRGTTVLGGLPSTECAPTFGPGRCTGLVSERWNPVAESRAFGTGIGTGARFALSGGSTWQDARLSTTARRVTGIAIDDRLSQVQSRLNLAQRLGTRVELVEHVSYSRNDAHDSRAGEIITQAYLRAPEAAQASSFRDRADSLLHLPAAVQSLEHLTIGGSLVLRPVRWFTLRGTLARDRVDGQTQQATGRSSSRSTERRFDESTIRTSRLTGELGHSIPSLRIRGSFTAGLERYSEYRDAREQSRTPQFNNDLPLPGLSDPLVTSSYSAATWDNAQFAQERVIIADRLVVAIGARRERVGFMPDWQTHPMADIAWLVGQRIAGAAVRPRAAYGESGARFTTFARPELTGIFGASTPPQLVVDPEERSRETEAGVDLDWGARAGVSLTAYRRDTKGVVPPAALVGYNTSTGGSSSSMSEMEIRNQGVEVEARARVRNGHRLRWDLRGVASANSNRVSRTAVNSWVHGLRVATGEPLYGGVRWVSAYADENQDGVITGAEVTRGEAIHTPGQPRPTFEGSIHSAMKFGDRLSVGVLLDHRRGAWSSTGLEALQCRSLRCHGLQDPSASMDEQAAAWNARANVISVDDASFTRLREVTLLVALPARQMGVGAGSVSLVLAGRDLFTWTAWRGPDPEINTNRRALIIQDDVGGVPLPRRFMIGLQLGSAVR